MKKRLLFFFFFICIANVSFAQLIISQVYEGDNDNKWIEITNTGLVDLNLSSPIQYKVGIWQQAGSLGNGAIIGSPTSFVNLSGVLAKGTKYLIKHTNAATNVPHAVMPTANDANATVASFDGNDALAIFTDASTIVDAFGVGINNSQLSYTRGINVLYSKATFTTGEWISESLATISTKTIYNSGYIGTHKFSGYFYNFSNSLATISKVYGEPSTIGSFTVERKSSVYLLPMDISGGGPPPPPGFTPPTYLSAPVDFEFSLTSDFSSAIGTSSALLSIDSGNTEFVKTLYYRLAPNATVGNKSGMVLFTFNMPSLTSNDFTIPTNPINPVTAKTISISGLSGIDKIFDGTTTATLTGLPVLNGVLTNDVAQVSLTGTPIANFVDALPGTNKSITVSGYTLSGSAAFNYALQQPVGLSASILPSGLASQSINFEQIPSNLHYGDGNFALSASSSASLPVTFTSSNSEILSITDNVATISGAGEVTITASQPGNTEFEAAVSVIQTITILPKQLTVSDSIANDKVYDGTTSATFNGGILNGIINSDDVSFTSTATFSDANVGNAKSVTVAYNLTGQDATNYSIENTNLSASITPRPISLFGFSVANKVYDRTNLATTINEPSLSGIVQNDLYSVTLTGNLTAAFNTANVGNNKPIALSGYQLIGPQAGNYVLVFPTNLTASITVKEIAITGLTVENKIYDRTTTASIIGSPSLVGVLSGDEQQVELTGNLSANFNTFNVGVNKAVAVIGGILAGSAAPNYSLAALSLTASITPKDVFIANALALDKAYDATTEATINGTLSGVISPDIVNLNLTAQYNDSSIGINKPVTSTSFIIGANASNYVLLQPSGLTSNIVDNPCVINSGYVVWNGTSTTKSSSTFNGGFMSVLSRGNNNGNAALIATANPSNYSGASGTSNYNAAAFVGALNTQTSTYFQFTINPNNAISVALTGIEFGSRSNSNGPKAFSIRSSVDNYATSIASGTLNANSVWAMNTIAISQPIVSSTPITYRIYGYNGTGSNSSVVNWRIDDLKILLSPTSSPALNSATSLSICSNSAFNYSASTPYNNTSISWTRAAVQGISNEAVTSPQNTNPSEVLINTTNSAIDVVYRFSVQSGTCIVNQDVTVTVNPSTVWYQDSDADGFGNAMVSQLACEQPSGYVVNNQDCDDSTYSLTNACNTILNLKMFIQGYYAGPNQMNSAKTSSQGVALNYVDDVEVELRNASFDLVANTHAQLMPDGNAQCVFDTSVTGLYYVVVRGTNSIKTCSSTPISISTEINQYDFSDGLNKAYGNNMIEMSSGVWAIMSGDVNNDGNVDNGDYSVWEVDASQFAFGDYVTDLNGDGSVDNGDYSIWEQNANSFVYSILPTP